MKRGETLNYGDRVEYTEATPRPAGTRGTYLRPDEADAKPATSRGENWSWVLWDGQQLPDCVWNGYIEPISLLDQIAEMAAGLVPFAEQVANAAKIRSPLAQWAIPGHTPGFDEMPFHEWHRKANKWENGLGDDEPKVGEFVEVMCCWGLRRAKATGVPTYGEVIAVTDKTPDKRNSVPGRWRWATYHVRIHGDDYGLKNILAGGFGSSAYLRKMSDEEVKALENGTAPRPTPLPPAQPEPPEPPAHPRRVERPPAPIVPEEFSLRRPAKSTELDLLRQNLSKWYTTVTIANL